jgi:cytoskeletal protein RodZ
MSRAILADVSIGESLAQARDHAGLTVAEVSARTRIRESLIRSIEQNEFGACGGDFYARGHIRAIATAIGIDSQALISEYDAAHPSARPPMLDNPPDRSPPRRKRGPSWMWPGAVLLLVVIGVTAYQLASGASGPSRPISAARAATTRPESSAARPAQTPSQALRPARPRPSPTAAPVTELTPASAVAFGPAGTADGDNPQNAPLALSGDPATPWHTNWYTTARFGDLQDGTGLLLDLGRTVTITSAAIRLGNIPGAGLQLRAGISVAHLVTVASYSGAGGLIRLRLASLVAARYLLIWFTLLPPDAAGTYQADVSGVTVTATS